MSRYCGYYSVIQYCPNRTLMEAASIGVLMWCPDLKYVGVRVTQTNRRIERILGRKAENGCFLQTYKEGLEPHFRKKFPHGASFEEMQEYLRTFVNRPFL